MHHRERADAVPAVDVRLDVAEQPSGGHVAEHQRPRAVPVVHAAPLDEPGEHRHEHLRADPRRIAEGGDPLADRPPRMPPDRRAVQRGRKADSAGEELAAARGVDHAEADRPIADKADRDAPARQSRDVGLRAVDRVDHPDPLPLGEIRRSGLLAEEGIVGKALREAAPDQELGLEVGLARHVLKPLGLDLERTAVGEKAQRMLARRADEREREVESVGKIGFGGHEGPQGQSRAAPRTPLASPCTALRMGV